MSACDPAGVVLEPRHDPRRHPGEQDRHQVGPLRRQRGEVREHAGVQHREQLRELRAARRTWRTCLSLRRRQRVPLVLLAHRHDDLVEQRVAQARDLDPRARLGALVVGVVEQPRLAPARGAPDARARPCAAIGSDGTEPSRVSFLIGTRIAIVCTLSVAVASTPIAGTVAIRCRFCSGRRSPRSKIDPRSTKNPSLRWPANTVDRRRRASAPPDRERRR